jgi:hypothetical protein
VRFVLPVPLHSVRNRNDDNVELNYLFSMPDNVRINKSRRMGWAVHVTCVVETSCIPDFGGKTCMKEWLGRPGHRRQCIKMERQGAGWMDRIGFVGVVTGTSFGLWVMNLRVP